MKKIFLILLATIISSACLLAQHTQFGIKAGLNSSYVDRDGAIDYDSKLGFHVGGLAHIHVSNHFAVQPEIVFSTQGGEYGDEKLKLNYINVPVLAQYMTSGLRLQTGPQFGFLVAAERKLGNVEVDVDDAFNSFDFSWSFGAGYLFSSGLGIDARYNLGITDISEDNAYDAKNRVFQVGLFYQFMKNTAARKR